MTPAALLIDLDGTLTDSRAGIFASISAALTALGHDPDPSIDLTFMVGPPLDDVMGELLARYGDARVADALAAYRRHYGTVGLYQNAVYDGIPAFLAAMKAAGRRLYLATSKRRIFAETILERFELSGYFNGIHGSEMDGTLGHKPELIAHILDRYAIAPAKAIMIGDRRYDISGAHANGVRAIGVLWGYGSRDELEQAGADALAAFPKELTAILDTHSLAE